MSDLPHPSRFQRCDSITHRPFGAAHLVRDEFLIRIALPGSAVAVVQQQHRSQVDAGAVKVAIRADVEQQTVAPPDVELGFVVHVAGSPSLD
jgi:hypothetical protein